MSGRPRLQKGRPHLQEGRPHLQEGRQPGHRRLPLFPTMSSHHRPHLRRGRLSASARPFLRRESRCPLERGRPSAWARPSLRRGRCGPRLRHRRLRRTLRLPAARPLRAARWRPRRWRQARSSSRSGSLRPHADTKVHSTRLEQIPRSAIPCWSRRQFCRLPLRRPSRFTAMRMWLVRCH